MKASLLNVAGMAASALVIAAWAGGCGDKPAAPSGGPGQTAATAPAAAAGPAAEPQAPKQGQTRLAKSPKGAEDVEIFRDGKWVNLTKFSRPQIIFAREVSDDGRYAMVWHCENPPRVLSIYDAKTGATVHSFVPGHGGMLRWTPADTILHKWPGVASVIEYAVYDVHGKTVDEGRAAAIKVSEDARYLVSYPPSPQSHEPLIVRDLCGGKVVYDSTKKLEISFVDEVEWRPDGLLVKYSDKDDQDKDVLIPLGK